MSEKYIVQTKWKKDKKYFDTRPIWDTLENAKLDFDRIIKTRDSIKNKQPIRLIKRTVIEKIIKTA